MKIELINYLHNSVIRTRTQEEYDELMRYYEYLGFRWDKRVKPTMCNNFPPCYRHETYIYLGTGDYLYYDTMENYLMSGYIVFGVSFSNFKEEFINKDENYQIYLKK